VTSVLFEMNHRLDFETIFCDHRLDAGFVTSKKRTTIIYVQSLQFRFNSSAEIVCNQPKFSRI